MFDPSKIEKNKPLSQNAAVIEFAKQMEVGDSYLCATKKEAGILRRAIEDAHGERTSTERNLSDGIRVWRIQQRPAIVRQRKPKAE